MLRLEKDGFKMQMTFSIVIGYILGLMIVFVLAKISLKPIKFVLRILLNSALGGVALLIINTLGKAVGIHIGINAITSVAVGILGLPAIIAMLILQLLF